MNVPARWIFGNVTDTPVRYTATTTIFLFATQAAWRIPTETVCSSQAAILQVLSTILSGDGLGEKTRRIAVIEAVA
jgi:hypothetical protein